MFDLPYEVAATLVKYGGAIVIVSLAVGLLHSSYTKLRTEPKTLAKLVLVSLAPPTLAIVTSYGFMYQVLGTPIWLNVVAAFAIYGFASNFLDKHVTVRFKDEEDNL